MDTLEKMTKNDKFAKLVGIKLLEVSEGYAKAELTLEDMHLNGLGIAHGGAIFTLADLVFAAASNSRGADAVAININISYFQDFVITSHMCFIIWFGVRPVYNCCPCSFG